MRQIVFSAIFTFLIGYVATATHPLAKSKLTRKYLDVDHYFLSKFCNIEAPGTKNGQSCPETEL